ncbi:MAG: PAS domain S-box protein, partial [Anaerolineales bacterium]|nr:PAS domain S-box protein [Anaerolineales bacterium]
MPNFIRSVVLVALSATAVWAAMIARSPLILLLLSITIIVWIAVWHRQNQQAQRRTFAARLATLSQLGLSLNATLDVASVLNTTAVQLQKVVSFDGLSLLLTTDDPNRLERCVHKPPNHSEVTLISVDVPVTPLEASIIANKEPLVIHNTAVDARWNPTNRPANSRVRSWVGVPMIVQDQVIGLLNMCSETTNHFTEQDVHLLLVFANQSAIALTNAQLYQQTQQELAVRRDAETALRQSESRFRSLYETMTQGVYYRDIHGRVTSSNPAAEEILGQTLAQMNQAYDTDMPRPVLQEDGTPFTPLNYPTNIALQTGQTIRNCLMRIYNPRQKQYRWIILDAVPEFLPGEEAPFQVYAIFRDVIEQREANEALEVSEARFRTLFETMSQGVIYRDKHGRVVDANPALRRIFQLDQDGFQREYDFHGVEWQIFDEWGHPLTFDDMPSTVALRTGQPILQQLRQYLNPETGEQRWLMIDAIPQFRRGETEPYQAYMVINDITLQKQAEEALRQAQKMESLGILAGGIAHDFNNLLVALLGQSSLASRKLDPEHPAYRHIQKVMQAAEHAASLTRQMLAYSGKGRFEVKHLQLNDLI